MIARLRGTALASAQDAHDTAAHEGAFYRDGVPDGATRDAQPDYSAARERMHEYYRSLRDKPVETGE